MPERVNLYRINQEQPDKLMHDKNDTIIVSAGYNHSMCLTRTGKIYTWGYNGKGILGRKKGLEGHLALEIMDGEFVAKVP